MRCSCWRTLSSATSKADGPPLGPQQGLRERCRLPTSDSSSASAITTSDTAGGGLRRHGAQVARPDITSLVMLQCLFALVFASLSLGAISFLDLSLGVKSCDSQSDGYFWCATWEDLRALFSFLLGVALYRIKAKHSEAAIGRPAVQEGDLVARGVPLYMCIF
mmetsp:Transcript_57485/g.124295  ORF Transcript_57485/g.124295 Transcript_57485/m.124295 type:complete len:163 (-) Transcript_57485:146-634(-)